jgi:signal transduction histidine kinase
MSLRVRLIVLSSAWLVFILVVSHTVLYYFVVNITTASEKELLLTKAQTILENEKAADPKAWADPSLLDEYLVSDEMIRIVGLDGETKVQARSSDELPAKPAAVVDRPRFEIRRVEQVRYLYVDVPILTPQGQVGTLEICRLLRRWNDYMDVFTSALVATSVGAFVLSVIGSYFYSRFLVQPIRHLASTMQLIQQSGTFRKLDEAFVSTRDELGELGITFNAMIARLEELVRKQRRFVIDASHELRTPLTIIESYASLLKRWGASDPDVREEAVEAIASEAQRLKGLVRSLMQLAGSGEEEPLNRQRVNLTELVRSAASAMEVGYQRTVAVEARQGPIHISGDPEKLKQLLLILLDNAIKYSSKPVRVRLAAEADGARIAVIDRGVGIPEDELRHVFDRFYRVDQARGRKTGGFGLGLAIAKSIVTRHGGTIGIASRVGAGTTLTVFLPYESS